MSDTPSHRDDRPASPAAIVQTFLASAKDALDAERWGEAASTLRAALELCDRAPGLAKFVPEILEKLVSALRRAEGSAAAVPYQRRVVAVHEASGPREPRLPASLMSLGFYLEEAGRADEAEKHIARALAMVEAGADDDPATVAVATSIAGVLCGRGERLDAAERLLRKARRGFVKVLGEDHPETASVVVQLAQLAMEDEREDEARSLLEEAIPVLEREVPPQKRLAEGLMLLGQIRMDEERAAEAIVLFERAEAVYRALTGDASVEVLGCVFQRGLAYKEQGRAELAEEAFSRALRGIEAEFGEDHEAVANIAEVYAELLDELGRSDEAEALQARAAAIREASEAEPASSP